jgi:GNAT superfamily N-acetyltransferase
LLEHKIEFTKNPTDSDIAFVTKQINQETLEYGEAFPFAFFIRDGEENIIGAANGFLVYGAIYTDQLWVNKFYRRQGFARKIMEKVHKFGKNEGCNFAIVQTMSFQGAQPFYEKLGYVQDFKRSGYVRESDCIFMRKSL